MKKLMTLVLAALPFVMYAQMPGMDFSNMQMELSEETIVNYTNGMVADYGLNEDQAAQVLEINRKYLGKVEYPVVLPPEAEEAMNNMGNRQGGAGFDMGSFSQEDRDRMMSMMNDMQERMNDIADNQEAYENALASVLDKKQMKKWKKAKKHYQTDQRIKMEAQFGGMGGFGGGMPGGGFGGGMPGGGFGGGMPGGGFGF
ncbi:MAG: DUF4890 domain-containing protein [Bacteroidales bacterium]|nr:DUF4890 domain-containing protein [Bacteroidales bacterium]